MTTHDRYAHMLDAVRAAPIEGIEFAVPESAAVAHLRQALAAVGIPCDDESTEDTPRRFLAALRELTSGTALDPARHLQRTFPPPSADPGMVVVPGVQLVSLCEHHLLPVTGTAAVGYLPSPGARLVGVSKLPRVAQEYAARPQLQERLGDQIVQAITSSLDTMGAACIIRAVHSCMTLRGACATGAAMVTSHMVGRFRDDPAVRAEFMTLAAAT